MCAFRACVGACANRRAACRSRIGGLVRMHAYAFCEKIAGTGTAVRGLGEFMLTRRSVIFHNSSGAMPGTSLSTVGDFSFSCLKTGTLAIFVGTRRHSGHTREGHTHIGGEPLDEDSRALVLLGPRRGL